MDVSHSNPVGEGRGSPRDAASRPTPPRPAAETTGPNVTVQVPKSGGPLPTSRTDKTHDRKKSEDERPESKERRVASDAVLAAIRMRADVNLATDVRIEVDLKAEAPRFLVVARESGEVLRVISEEDTKRILDEIPEAQGLMLDDRG